MKKTIFIISIAVFMFFITLEVFGATPEIYMNAKKYEPEKESIVINNKLYIEINDIIKLFEIDANLIAEDEIK